MPTVFITGTSSGIGRDTVFYFAKKGWNVAATMRQISPIPELSDNKNVRYYSLDVTKHDTIVAAWEAALKDFGKIDVLVNNAGFGVIGPFEAASREQIEKQLDTNVVGLMDVVQTALPHFRANKNGTIVNVSSVAGRMCFPLFSLYHASKFAVEGFTESLHYELKPFGIKVRLIEPGTIRTDFFSRSKIILKKDGLTAYDTYTNNVLSNFDHAEKFGEGPASVVKAIYKAAISSSYSKIRYVVGGGGPLMIWTRKLIPTFLLFPMIRFVVEKPWFKKK